MPRKKTYAIGYGKPPQGRKFAKGQSGNPGGRPRKSTMDEIPASTRSLFLDIMQRKVSIREGEEIKKISMKEAVLRAHVTTAMKGNALAQRDVTQFAMRCEKESEEAHWEKYHRWTEYKEKYTALTKRSLIRKLHEMIKQAPDAALILKFPTVSIRRLLARAGCETINEYAADLRTEALRELDMT